MATDKVRETWVNAAGDQLWHALHHVKRAAAPDLPEQLHALESTRNHLRTALELVGYLTDDTDQRAAESRERFTIAQTIHECDCKEPR